MMGSTKRPVVPAAEEILDLYFPVLDHGFVALKDYQGSDKSIERAARCSYNFEEKDRKQSDTENLIRYLMRHRHSTPFEMVNLTLHVGLPIFVMRQLIRHRLLSVNEYSGRYSVMPLMYYTPPPSRMKTQSQTNKQGSDDTLLDDETYNDYLSDLNITREKIGDLYKNNLSDNVANELARLDLPLSMYTYCYIETDLRNLFHLIGLRSDSHAQEEIRAYSDIFGGIAKRLCPISTQAYLDYQFNSVTFSHDELNELKKYWTSDTYRETVHRRLSNIGFTKREQTEFSAKLEKQSPKDFNLDVSIAKPGEFFSSMIQKHAIEIPKHDT